MTLAVNLERRFVFIHVPKTGGQSITARLDPFNDLHQQPPPAPLGAFWTANRSEPELSRASEAGHWRYRDLVTVLGQSWVDQQTIYAVVRNPLDKIVSAYEYTKAVWQMENLAFERWLLGQDDVWRAQPLELALHSQYWYVTNLAGCVPANVRLLRYEQFEPEVDSMFEAVGLPCRLKGLRLHAARGRRPYEEYYTSALARIVADRFSADFRLFYPGIKLP